MIVGKYDVVEVALELWCRSVKLLMVKLFIGDNRITWVRLLWQFISEIENNVLFHLGLLDHAEISSVSFESLHLSQKPVRLSQKLDSPLLLGKKKVNSVSLGAGLDHKLGRRNNMAVKQRKQAATECLDTDLPRVGNYPSATVGHPITGQAGNT